MHLAASNGVSYRWQAASPQRQRVELEGQAGPLEHGTASYRPILRHNHQGPEKWLDNKETADDRILKLVEDTTLTKAEFDAELAMLYRIKLAEEFAEGLRLTPPPADE